MAATLLFIFRAIMALFIFEPIKAKSSVSPSGVLP